MSISFPFSKSKLVKQKSAGHHQQYIFFHMKSNSSCSTCQLNSNKNAFPCKSEFCQFCSLSFFFCGKMGAIRHLMECVLFSLLIVFAIDCLEDVNAIECKSAAIDRSGKYSAAKKQSIKLVSRSENSVYFGQMTMRNEEPYADLPKESEATPSK